MAFGDMVNGTIEAAERNHAAMVAIADQQRQSAYSHAASLVRRAGADQLVFFEGDPEVAFVHHHREHAFDPAVWEPYADFIDRIWDARSVATERTRIPILLANCASADARDLLSENGTGRLVTALAMASSQQNLHVVSYVRGRNKAGEFTEETAERAVYERMAAVVARTATTRFSLEEAPADGAAATTDDILPLYTEQTRCSNNEGFSQKPEDHRKIDRLTPSPDHRSVVAVNWREIGAKLIDHAIAANPDPEHIDSTLGAYSGLLETLVAPLDPSQGEAANLKRLQGVLKRFDPEQAKDDAGQLRGYVWMLANNYL